MAVIAVIPARFASTRFPAKPLAADTGKPLIQHVWERVSSARLIDRVIVATDDARILDAVTAFGGEARMTRADHPNGTYRVAEVMTALGLTDADLVLNVQGDEPELDPSVLDRLIERMQCRTRDLVPAEDQKPGWSPAVPVEEKKPGWSPAVPVEEKKTGWSPAVPVEEKEPGWSPAVPVEEKEPGWSPAVPAEARRPGGSPTASRTLARAGEIGTLACPFPADSPLAGPGSPADPNCVKVVLDAAGRALYFSRSLVPYPRPERGAIHDPSQWLLHLGVYAFRPSALAAVTGANAESRLAQVEALEQLAWLASGWTVAVEVVPPQPPGVDTPEDYAAFVARVRRHDAASAGGGR